MTERLRVLRVYHAGRDAGHRARDRALLRAGVDVHLAVPRAWPGGGDGVEAEPFPVSALDVARTGDVNRHRYCDVSQIERLLAAVQPDVLDLHEEPFSVSTQQWLRAAPRDLPVVLYTAQNVDKRFPPPFHGYERRALRRAAGLYPCSAQAASVARGKGFRGRLRILPLGYDDAVFRPGPEQPADGELALAFVGRLVPEKGVLDAVSILARVQAERTARLVVCGDGPLAGAARRLAASLGVGERLELAGSLRGAELAGVYRAAHVVLVPSRPTATWVEQFGRVVVEAQACGAVVAGYASGSIPEVAGPSAVLVPAGDVDGLAAAVTGLAADRADWARRRAEGIAAARGCTWEHVAAAQLELYRLAVEGSPPSALPASPRRRRAAARAELGPTAATVAGTRPFALPVLRNGGVVPAVLGRALDAIGEAAAQASRLR